MSKFLNFKLLLLAIVLIGGFLRFSNLSSNPPSLTWDEASWGYNAYSIGIDGKDEFGRFLPLNYLESFGDFKPPLYAYLDVIPVKIFGLNEFTTRFPSALFGTLTILVTYFLVKRIFDKSKNKEKYAILTALILALSPWHIMLSRAAFEANVSSFFIITAVWAFLAAVHERKWYLLISAVFFGLSIYTFNTARIVSPILAVLLTIGFRAELLKIKKEVILAAILGFLVILPILSFLFTPQASLRFKEVNIFSDLEIVKTANQEIANDKNSLFSKLIHNRRLLYSVSYIRHYFDNLSTDFLFIKGDGNPKFSTQNVGELYIWDIIFLVGGAIFLIKKKEGSWWLIFLWLIVGIIPAATARETPHALRIEAVLPTFQVITAFGFVQLTDLIKKRKKEIISFFLILLFINAIYFYYDYVNHYAKIYSGEWQYGYKQSIDYVNQNSSSYNKVYFTQELGRPYIYYLFYTKTIPLDFRKNSEVKRDAFGFVDVTRVGKVNFKENNSISNLRIKDSLYITTKAEVPSDAKILKTVNLLNGIPSLVIYKL